MILETLPIADLIFDGANANDHDEESIDVLKASLRRFRYQRPILVRHDNVVVAGNGTLAAIAELNTEMPDGWERMDDVSFVRSDLQNAEAIAYGIADNRTAEYGAWNDDVLADHLGGLLADDPDLFAATGFTMEDFDELTADLIAADGEGDAAAGNATSAPDEPMNAAWTAWAGEIADQIERLAGFSGITPAYARVAFLRARYDGREYPRHCSLAFHPQQIDTPGSKDSVLEGLRLVAAGEINPERLRFVLSEKPAVATIISQALPFASARLPIDFPASLARDIIEAYAPGGSVLDPCHGWGGRLVGFYLSTATVYLGVDVSPLQSAGVQRIADEIGPLADGERSVSLVCDPFEDVELDDGAFDLALTSPPYFDVEKYKGGAQSHDTYANYPAWREGFYRTMITKTYAALRPGGTFAMQVGSQRFPLADDGRAIGRQVGFNVDATLPTDMRNSFCQTSDDDGEVVVVMVKPD